MVVVVILGILSAVGVPKLFGAIAKAKAAEVPVAAGTYISLQDAYISEGIALGSWKEIGYGAPSSQNFSYTQGCVASPIPEDDFTESIIGWQASNIVKLNDCSTGNAWAISMSPSANGKPTYSHVVSSMDCGVLTSGWHLGNVQTGDCATAPKNETPNEGKDSNKEETNNTTPSEPASSPSNESSNTPVVEPEQSLDDGDEVTNNRGDCPEDHYKTKKGKCVPGKALGLGKQEQNQTSSTSTGNTSTNNSTENNETTKVPTSTDQDNGSGSTGTGSTGTGAGSTGSGSGHSGGTPVPVGGGSTNIKTPTETPQQEEVFDPEEDICIEGNGNGVHNICTKWRPKSDCLEFHGNSNNCKTWKADAN